MTLIGNTKRTDVHSFARLLAAEWNNFRKARGRVIGMVVAALLTALPGLIIAAIMSGPGPNAGRNVAPIGPDGEAVSDEFYFVHQPLLGDGSMTVRVASLTGLITYPPPNHDQIVPGVVPWAKAGIMIKDGTQQGSAYAAMMVTGSHGVRMQYNFVNDIAGYPGSAPRWLRLTRSGDTITGYESLDGAQWTEVGTAHLTGLPASVQVGLFVTSPGNVEVCSSSGGARRTTNATAVFDNLTLQGEAPDGAWSYEGIGIGEHVLDIPTGEAKVSGDTFTVTGLGDVAPLVVEGRWTIERSLFGLVLGLIAVIVVAVPFAAAGSASGAQRGARLVGSQGATVLAAKAAAIGMVTLVVGLAATALAVLLGKHMLLSKGIQVLPVTVLTELRVVLGVAALLAVTAVLALALAAMLRRDGLAVAAGIALVVLPYLLPIILPLPMDAAQWLLRLTPAAGLAIQQSIPQYPQVTGFYGPLFGYFPLAPWAGFAVLCGYTVLALGLSVFLVKRRKQREL